MPKRYVEFPLLRKRNKVLCCDNILYVQADLNMSLLYMNNIPAPISVNVNLAKAEELINCSDFVKVHRSILVNLSHVLSYGKYPDKYIELSNGLFLPVAKRRKLEFHNSYIEYLKRQRIIESSGER